MSADIHRKARQRTVLWVICPYWGGRNPYQDLLAAHLSDLGLEVAKARTLRSVWLPLCRQLVTRRPVVLHLHWLPSCRGNGLRAVFSSVAFLARAAVLRLLGAKLICTVHNLLPHECERPRVDRLTRVATARLAHALIVHSHSARSLVVSAWRPHTKCNIEVIPHGNYIGAYENTIDRALARRQLGMDGFTTVMLFFGGIRPYKGLLPLVKAFRALGERDACLVIAGPSSDERLTRAIEQEIAGRPDIRFVPACIPPQQVQLYMNASDVVVLPYEEILTSGAVVLAMSFGRAIISPRRGCIQDQLDDRGAFLYDPDEDQGLLEAMRRALETNSDLLRMGLHNRKRAEQWDWRDITRATFAVYSRCLSGDSPVCGRTAAEH